MSPEGQPSFTVIIPAYNSGATLERSVRSVQATGERSVQIVVVDDASRDDSGPIYDSLERAGVTVVRTAENRGPAACRNAGAALSDSEWLVFLDSDDQLVPGWRDIFTGVIGPRTGLVEATYLLRGEVDTAPGFLAGAFAVRRLVFDTAGGYDDSLRYAENSELRWRLEATLREAGLGIARVWQPVVELQTAGESRDYDRARMDAAIHILEKHAERMIDTPVERSRHEAIVAVNAARIGEWQTARSYAVRAFVSRPSPRNAVRLVAYSLRLPPRNVRDSHE